MDLHFTEKGTPFSPVFEEAYFSDGYGFEETDYVFLQGNNLAERFQSSSNFSIGETGFGTGLNFMMAADIFLKKAPENAKLTFISCELYPLTRIQLKQAHENFVSLSHISEELLKLYPDSFDQIRNELSLFDGKITLIFLNGKAAEVFKSCQTQVDAWFLDGFSPAKNPEMWNETVFAELFRLSKKDTTLTTFTAAGAVRRGLVAVGFEVKRIKGFGYKKHMTTACKI